MKAYTDIEQSKKLAEILPKESADMYYFTIIRDYPYSQGKIKTIAKIMDGSFSSNYDTPCWSLAALLDVLESEIDGEEGETYKLKIEKEGNWWNVWYEERYDEANPIETESTEYLVDACYKMILDLHELKLL